MGSSQLHNTRTSQGEKMDPWSYMKVKCVADKTPTDSAVIKGLVFKKTLAHKCMRSHIENPKLLLVKGDLGRNDSGLSSLNVSAKENDYMENLFMEMVDTYQLDVILVEKIMPLHIKNLLKKDISLVANMNQNCLERISRCTGSTVTSFSDVLKDPTFISCDLFRIERFVEEHNDAGGEKPTTLMYLEGFSKPLGCTILLRGASTKELKKLKHVLRYTVFAAYNLIIESSFFEDQRVFLNDKIAPKVGSSTVPHLPSLSDGRTQYNPKPSQNKQDLPLLPGIDRVKGSTEERSTDIDKEVAACKGCIKEGSMHGNDSETILVMTTSQCITKESKCEQSCYNRIKYYGYCDISLGQYLQYLLLGQGLSCSTCGEPQEAHEHLYTHQNGNLTVTVKRLEPEHHLSGENEGNIWMWSRCLICEGETGNAMATPRVVMSPSARRLSFGKFLELGFSSKSSARSLSKCGHLLHQDCLRFFGLGSKVAMFWYNPIEVFTAFKPPAFIEFNNPYRQRCLKDEIEEKIRPKGLQLFSEIESVLQRLKRMSDSFISAHVKAHSKAEDMFYRERADFKNLLENIKMSETNEDTANALINLNWAYQDLVLRTYVWDHRLHHLLHRPSDEEHGGSEKTERDPLIEDTENWFWAPFAELNTTYRNGISSFHQTKFFIVNAYTPKHLNLSFLNEEEGPIQFSVGPDGSILIVCEDEISSIISRALTISEIKRKNIYNIESALEKSDSLASMGSWPLSEWPSGDLIESAHLPNTQHSRSFVEDVHPEVTVCGMLRLEGEYAVVCLCAEEFYNVRKKYCQSEMKFIISLSRSAKWDAQGGKSKAFFAKTKDERFIIKEINRAEFESFLKFKKEYFKYVNESLDSGNPTALAKILGIYEVRQMRNGKEIKKDLMVMENLFFGKNICRTYDLKGSIYSRHIPSLGSLEDMQQVFLDGNFIEDLGVSPFYIGVATKQLLECAIWNDTAFLNSIDVMDYSLLVGIDKQRHDLVFGIIDYLRQYTWDKMLETRVKSSLVVPKNMTPTIVSPEEYKKRFRNFMIKHFFSIPDSWICHPSSDDCAGSCKLCGLKKGKVTQIPDIYVLGDS